MKIVCAWCEKTIGYKPGEGITHGICQPCMEALLGTAEAVSDIEETDEIGEIEERFRERPKDSS
jgi:hypothetical protein